MFCFRVVKKIVKSRLFRQCTCFLAGAVGENTQDEFWDYDRQVDLEGFSSRRVYDTLARQSRNVTQTLAKQKDEVGMGYLLISLLSFETCMYCLPKWYRLRFKIEY